MNSMNLVFAAGNIGRIDFRETSKTPVINLSLAINERIKTKDGSVKDKTEWVNVVAFGGTAELIAKHCKKGDQLGVMGSISTSSYEDKDGKKQYSTKVQVQKVISLPPFDTRTKENNNHNDEPPFDLEDSIPF